MVKKIAVNAYVYGSTSWMQTSCRHVRAANSFNLLNAVFKVWKKKKLVNESETNKVNFKTRQTFL